MASYLFLKNFWRGGLRSGGLRWTHHSMHHAIGLEVQTMLHIETGDQGPHRRAQEAPTPAEGKRAEPRNP
eukprot:6946533-Pyramimonas_sp.AAC.1